MSWLLWVGLLIAGVVVAKKLFLSPKDFGAATNALLAEHYLSNATPEAKKRVAGLVMEVLKAGGFPNMPEDRLVGQFNRRERFIQLNVVALALERGGIHPRVQGEIWHSVRNPFQLNRVEANIQAVADRLKAQMAERPQLGSSPLAISAGSIEG
jgi:hypothetical protein